MKQLFTIFGLACLVLITMFYVSCVNKLSPQDTQIIEAMQPVAKGEGVAQAASYTHDGVTNPVVLICTSGKIHDWTDDIPTEWKPTSLGETELVICVGEEKEKSIQVCQYTGPSVTRYQHYVDVELREAKTGILVASTILYGSMPSYCKGSEDYYVTRLDGSDVSFDQLKSWLETYVIQ